MADKFSFIEEALAIFENQNVNIERFSKVSTSVKFYRIHIRPKEKKGSANFLNPMLQEED